MIIIELFGETLEKLLDGLVATAEPTRRFFDTRPVTILDLTLVVAVVVVSYPIIILERLYLVSVLLCMLSC